MEGYRYRAVESHIIRLLDSGALNSGDKLPSLRGLSRSLRVSVSTVNQAYLELEKRGVIESKPRSGFFVNEQLAKMPAPVVQKGELLEPTTVNRSQLIKTVLHAIGDRSLTQLGIIEPASKFLPCNEIGRSMRSILKENPYEAINYASVEGWEPLRRQICFRSLDAGISITPDDVLITHGAMEALYLALRTLTRPGDNVLIQSPAYFCFLQLLENCGLRAIEVPSSPEHGVDIEKLQLAVDKYDIKACIFNANFSNPDGSVSSAESKKEIVRILAKRNIPLVEDDVSGETAFNGEHPSTFKQFDTTGTVFYCSSYSKTLVPGYRIGWCLPGKFYSRTYDVKATTNVCSVVPTQIAVADYLATGKYNKHLKKLQAIYEHNMHTMLGAIARFFPEGTRATRPKGGGVIWIELPAGVDGVRLFYKASEHGIGIAPGSIFSTHEEYSNYIRLSFCGEWSDATEEGMKTLGKLIADMV
ncbi:MAG: PLP-dependent aminotransferase family protein [Desulfovibrio sp.]